MRLFGVMICQDEVNKRNSIKQYKTSTHVENYLTWIHTRRVSVVLGDKKNLCIKNIPSSLFSRALQKEVRPVIVSWFCLGARSWWTQTPIGPSVKNPEPVGIRNLYTVLYSEGANFQFSSFFKHNLGEPSPTWYQSPPEKKHSFRIGNPNPKPLFATGILGGGGRSNAYLKSKQKNSTKNKHPWSFSWTPEALHRGKGQKLQRAEAFFCCTTCILISIDPTCWSNLSGF